MCSTVVTCSLHVREVAGTNLGKVWYVSGQNHLIQSSLDTKILINNPFLGIVHGRQYQFYILSTLISICFRLRIPRNKTKTEVGES